MQYWSRKLISEITKPLVGIELDPEFLRLHDGSDRAAHLRHFIEVMWKKYAPHCPDKDFIRRFQTDFLSHAWQMLLTHSLIKCGCELLPSKPNGPDVLVVASRVPVIVEAVAPQLGNGANSYPKHAPGTAHDIDVRKILLRISSAISSKVEQHQKWIESKIVSRSQPFVIAVCTGSISDTSMDEFGFSFMEKCLFGRDAFDSNLHFAKVRKEAPTECLQTNAGGEVCINIFQRPEFSQVSGVFYCGHHFLENFCFNGDDFRFVHNPNALNPVPFDTFRVGRERNWEDGRIVELNWSRRPLGQFSGNY